MNLPPVQDMLQKLRTVVNLLYETHTVVPALNSDELRYKIESNKYMHIYDC